MNHRLPCGLDVEGEAAKLFMKELVLSGRVYGVLAYAEGESIPVGWCAVDRRKTLPGHDCVREAIDCSESHWSIHCVTARQDFRQRGVEEFLSEEGLRLAQKLGADIVEAYPEPGSRAENGFRTWNTFGGHQSSYERLGFAPDAPGGGHDASFYQLVKWRG